MKKYKCSECGTAIKENDILCESCFKELEQLISTYKGEEILQGKEK